MSKAEEYRKQAEQCRDSAKRMTEREARDQMLKMAESWERLASDIEDEAKQPELPPPPGQPSDKK
jgi:hypothetical protein